MILFRSMEPKDQPQLEERGREQNERDGTSYPVPQVYDHNGRLTPNVPLALVAEENGTVLQGHLFLRTIEMMSFGIDPRATAVSRRHFEAAMYVLQNKGYNGVHCQIPREHAGHFEPLMNKLHMKRDDHRLAHFYRDLREAE